MGAIDWSQPGCSLRRDGSTYIKCVSPTALFFLLFDTVSGAHLFSSPHYFISSPASLLSHFLTSHLVSISSLSLFFLTFTVLAWVMTEPTTEPHDRVLPASDDLNGSISNPSEKENKERDSIDKEVKDAKETKDAKDVKDVKDSDTTSKPVCKKHEKKKKVAHKKEESDTSGSDSSSNSDSDADSDSDSESESSTDKRRRHRLRTKARARRALKDKKRRKKKHRSRKVDTSDSNSDSESESDTATSTESDVSMDEKALRKLVTKLKLKKKAKKLRDQTSDDLAPSDPVAEGRQKRSKKKKPASKVAYKRVDQCELQRLVD